MENTFDKETFESWLLKRIKITKKRRDKLSKEKNMEEIIGKGGQLKIYYEILEYIKKH